MPESRLPGFHGLDCAGRLDRLEQAGWLNAESRLLLESMAPAGRLDECSENVIAQLSLPLGVVTNVVVNQVPRLIPMATEEPSVVAACSKAALMAGKGGVVSARAGERLIEAHVLFDCDGAPDLCDDFVRDRKEALAAEVARRHPEVAAAGGGLVGLVFEERLFASPGQQYFSMFEITCHPGDAMGANFVNDVAEYVGQEAQTALPGKVVGAILTNVAPGRPARAEAMVPCSALATAEMEGAAVADGIRTLSDWALADRRRRVTHVKGILNGMEGLMTALHQDTRALAAAVWVHAAGQNASIARWWVQGDELIGVLETPIVCGTRGGTGAVMPASALFHKWMAVERAGDLEEVTAAVGLLQNLGALHAIATTGIQQGHMKLHERKRKRR